MAPTRTRTVKNKHASNKSGIKNSKDAKRSHSDGVVKPRKPGKGKGGGAGPPSKQVQQGSLTALINRKKKKKTYTEKELAIPTLNAITPVGVVKPKGKKKGKVFVDDQVGWPLPPFSPFPLPPEMMGEKPRAHGAVVWAEKRMGRRE